jgi:Tol biopolymer transport system component
VALLAIPFVPAAAGRASTPSLIVFSADRAPLVSEQIYRLDPDGHRVDLSQGPTDDEEPVVSPDGKKVAFFSYRNSVIGYGPQIFEMGIDGTQVRGMAPSLYEAGPVVWQPHGERLATIAQSAINAPFTLWILRWGHKPIRLVAGGGFGGGSGTTREPSWSPDGRVLVVWSGFKWRAFSPSGRRLWTHEGNREGACCDSSWSAHGLFAVTTEQKVRVYDESGRTQFTGRLPTGRFGGPSWSPDGREVGVATGKFVEVWTARGRPVLRKRVPILGGHKPDTVWASDRRLVVRDHITGRQEGVDVSTGRFWNASTEWFDPRSADGKLAAVTSDAGADLAIGVAPVGGGATKVYGAGTDCETGAWVRSLQFVGHSRSLVYESECNPGLLPSDLFAMAPDGTGLHEISGIEPNAAGAALSPDGTKIAYSWWSPAGEDGAEIRIVNVDGTEARVLATPPTGCGYGDVWPSWSPDGETILFTQLRDSSSSDPACVEPDELFTVPAAGGPVHDTGIAGYNAVWGPSRIAYLAPDSELTTANPDGSDPKVIAPAGQADSAAWSSDGHLAYTTGPSETPVVVDGSSVQLPFAEVTSLSWSPDGTRFVVTALESTKGYLTATDVYTVNTDGTDPVRLTTGYNARGAEWR